MSANSSNNKKHLGRIARNAPHTAKPRRRYRLAALLGITLWVLVAFVASQLIIASALWMLEWLKMPIDTYVSASVAQTIIAVLMYTLTLIIVVGVPYVVWRRRTTFEELGLTRLVSWGDIGLAPLAFIAYGLLTTIVLSIVTATITGFPADQVQDTGFSAFGSRLDNLLAFATLVILAPIAEEVLFRGYLYGKLKRYVPAIAAAIVTSLLFAVVHLQWNVGIDVFVLSLVLCGLRSLTGSIWAGILVHMIKNAIAYYILFINPLIGG